MKKVQKGFTLVELIVVITILAILGTIAFISLQGYSQDAKNSKITSDVRNLTSAIETGITDGRVELKNIVNATGEDTNRLTVGNYGSGKTIASTTKDGTTGPLYKVGEIDLTALRQSETDFNYEENVGGASTERKYIAGVLIDSDANNGKGYIVYQVAGQTPDPAGGKKPIVKGNWYKLDDQSNIGGIIKVSDSTVTATGVVDGVTVLGTGLY